MRSGGTWQTRAAGQLSEELVLSTVCYEGVSALEDRVNAQLIRRLKERAK